MRSRPLPTGGIHVLLEQRRRTAAERPRERSLLFLAAVAVALGFRVAKDVLRRVEHRLGEAIGVPLEDVRFTLIQPDSGVMAYKVTLAREGARPSRTPAIAIRPG